MNKHEKNWHMKVSVRGALENDPEWDADMDNKDLWKVEPEHQPLTQLNKKSSAARAPERQALLKVTGNVFETTYKGIFYGDFGYDWIQCNGSCSKFMSYETWGLKQQMTHATYNSGTYELCPLALVLLVLPEWEVHLPPTNPIQAATPAPDTTLPAGHQFLASVSNTFPVTALPVAPAGGTELPNILPVPAAQMEDLTLHNHSKQHLVALDLALLQTNPITLPSAMKVPTTTCGCADVIQETFIALGLGFLLVVIARSGV
ncbi:hypothetical protein EDD16DRAFT_1522386 [Pisolithus croceorrhizus]|nr:hypothetical protein EDD16DRAFT_1522386 [Pisolithus croceorrhizus]